MMKTSMIVVADSVLARFFTIESANSPLNEVKVMTHPEGRLHDRDITSDLPGKSLGSNGSGGHAYGSKVDPKKHELIEFSKQVADYIDDVRKSNKLSNLLVVAAPTFLGELRSQLSSETNDKIIFELNKNLTQHSVDEISTYLPKSFKL